MLTGLLYQGTWQRIFAARDNKVIRNGFIISGLLSFPIIFIMGLFGLAFVGLDLPGDGSVALFSVLLADVPLWFAIGLLPFGLALIIGVILRLVMHEWQTQFRVLAEGPNPAIETRLKKSIGIGRRVAYFYWILIMGTAFLGAVKPF